MYYEIVNWSTYPEYLGLINRIASDNDLPHEKVEMFLFEYGGNIKEITC
jgi:hypothetical protein